MAATKTHYEIVEGTRLAPGRVLRMFAGEYKCGGAATACLRAFTKLSRTTQCFFRKVA